MIKVPGGRKQSHIDLFTEQFSTCAKHTDICPGQGQIIILHHKKNKPTDGHHTGWCSCTQPRRIFVQLHQSQSGLQRTCSFRARDKDADRETPACCATDGSALFSFRFLGSVVHTAMHNLAFWGILEMLRSNSNQSFQRGLVGATKVESRSGHNFSVPKYRPTLMKSCKKKRIRSHTASARSHGYSPD